jgi:hypothetical protein
LLSEISRGENVQGKGLYNQELEEQIYNLSKIVLSQEGETWLVMFSLALLCLVLSSFV